MGGISCKILGIAPMCFEKDEREFLVAGVDEFHEKPFTPVVRPNPKGD